MTKLKKYDFSGWATKNDLRCADGRIIRHNAFLENDGCTVPLVWSHQHQDPTNVLGHALLENRDEGVYAYCSFNDTPAGKNSKMQVQHGDITALSIYANRLKQEGPNVVHGMIREVSLVLAGANPGALIDNDSIMHSDGADYESEGVIYTNEQIMIHADEPEKLAAPAAPANEPSDDEGSSEETVQDVIDTMSEEQQNVMYYLIALAAGEIDDSEVAHADMEEVVDDDGRTVQDVLDSMTDKQRNIVYALVGMAAESAEEGDEGEVPADDEEIDHSDDYEDDYTMKHNIFDSTSTANEQFEPITHDEMMAVISDAKRGGSMREAAIAHGIEQIDILFPDAKTITNTPDWIKRETDWVAGVMSATHHTPFSRIKSVFADITEDEARAKGYIKGKLKKEEVFTLLKRSTDPQTIYKKQKMHRDDVIDITDFDVVSWIKSEMRMMLDEEIARAILVGDGRATSDDDHISEDHVRPVWKDSDLYTIKAVVNKGADESKTAKNFIRTAIKARKDYKGSGNPILYTTEDILTDMLLIEDEMGRFIYESEATLATKLRVSKIVTVPVMEGLTREGTGTDAGKTFELMGLIVNLTDYNVGADKGGEVNMFDDFDIDYNAQKYLIETRISGAMTKPYGAIALESVATTSANNTSEEPQG
jgi:hypothetical protein